MKKPNKKSNSKAKAILCRAGLFTGIFVVVAAGTFFAIPQRTDIIPASEDPVIELSGSQQLMQNIVESASTGLGATVTNGLVVLDGKADGFNNKIKLDGTQLKFKMASLREIDLVVDAKVDYNAKKRGLGLSMVDDMVYFNISDFDNDTWDLKYKVSTEAYDGEGIDPETGGQVQYSYGVLDWLIEDIVSILTEEGMDINFPSLGSLLDGSSSETPTETEGGTDEGGIDAQAILDSMNYMTEDADLAALAGDPHYFNWDLVLGDKTLELGLRSDAEYNLTGVDFPRIHKESDAMAQDVVTDLLDGMSLQLQLKMETNDLVFGVPEDAADYRSLENSVALFEKLAHAAGSMKFGVGLDLDLSYETEGEEGSIYKFAKEGLDDTANLSLTANVDAHDMKLNALNADLAFSHVSNEVTSSQNLSAIYLANTESKDMYINLNNTLRAKTNKVMLDEVVGSIKDALTSDPVAESDQASEEDKTAVQLFNAESAIGGAIEAVKNSDFMEGLKNGVYESGLDFIKEIVSTDNEIKIVISLEPLGIETGADDHNDIIIKLGDKTDVDGNPLLEIELNEIQFASFTVDGAIQVIDYEEVLAPSNVETYQEMSHLKGVTDQVLDLVDAKAATITLDGGFKFADASDVGVSLDGTIALDASTKNDLKAGIAIDVTEVEEHFTQHHNIKADIAQEDVAVEDGTKRDTRVFFTYDTINPEGMEETHTQPKTEEPINGTMSVGYAMDIVNSVVDWASGSLDNRFSRISRALAKPGGNALINDLTSGKYFALAGLKVIKSFVTSANKDVIVINASSLGLDQDIQIEINFKDDKSIASIGVSSIFNDEGMALDLTFGLESGAESNDLATLEDHDSSNYCDYNVVLDLAEYALGTTTVGAVKHEGHGQTTLNLEANVDLVLGDYSMNAVKLDGALSIDGAQLQAVANLNGLPTIKGLNAPESDRYFRDHEYEGVRDASFYYYADGLETNDEILMTRDSSYGKLRNVKDSVRMSNEIFNDDIGGWLLQYLLGVDASLFENEEEAAQTPVEEPTKTYGLPLKKAIHMMDLFHGIEVEENGDAKTYIVDLDLDKLGFGFLGTTSLMIKADTVKDVDDNSFKTLTGFRAEVNVALGGQLKIVKAVIDLSITNLAEHAYENIWNADDQFGYFTYFCPTVVIDDVPVYGEPTPYGYVSGNIDRNYKITESGLAGNYYVL